MTFLTWFLSPRSNKDWKSWRSLIFASPFVIGVLVLAPQAMRENSAAKRQQTSQGRVTSYDRSNHDQCGYTFLVNGKQYSGMAPAPKTNVTVGDRLLVYFDSGNPTINSTEDFSELSRGDQNFVYFLVAGIVAFAGFIAVCKVEFGSPEGRSGPK